MDFVRAIDSMYEGNIAVNPPYKGEKPEDIPEELFAVLQISDGIEETMIHPKTGERERIGWIVNSCKTMREDSSFFHEVYGIKGVVFADDGIGNPYILKSDGSVTQLEATDGKETKIAGSLREFYRL